MWLSIIFLGICGCSAQITMLEEHGLDLSNQLATDDGGAGTNICSTYSAMEPSLNLDIPASCCQFSTTECHFTYNGMCRLRWDTSDCDYTVDVCQTEQADYTANWFCTCCASCQGDGTSNECTDDNGVCRKCCHDDEFSAFWHKCPNDNCMCCKKHCPSETCVSGTGKCVHKTQDCPEGYSVTDTDECEGIDCKCCQKNINDDCFGTCASGTGTCMTNMKPCPQGYYSIIDDECKGFNCQCCKPCRKDEKCIEKQGFCEWLKKDCPPNYIEDDCPCPDEECRCCRPGFIDDDKIERSGRGIIIKQKQEMVVEIPQNP